MKRNENVLTRWIMLKQNQISIETLLFNRGYKKIIIYGFGKIGECLFYELINSGVTLEGIVDKRGKNIVVDYPCTTIENMGGMEADAVVVTVLSDYENIKKCIKEKMDVDVISIEELIYEL